MRIAFLSLNREKLPDPVIPLGLLSVAANVGNSHEKEVWDLCFAEEPLTLITENIKRFQPQVIAVGIRNIQNNDYTGIESNLATYKLMLSHIRSLTDATIIIGGSAFSVMPVEFMTALKPDFGIKGEGEINTRRLVEKLATNNQTFSDLPNLFYFKNNQLEETKSSGGYIELDELALPVKDGFLNQYYAVTGTDSIQTKRGCVFECSYCTYPKIEGRHYRLRDPQKVVSEMAAILARNNLVRHFFFVDSVFNSPLSHAKQICHEMIKQKMMAPWTCYASPRSFDAELASLMSMSKCAGIEVGSDSGSDKVLRSLKKGFTTADIEKMHKLCVEHGIKDCHTFILSTPEETPADVEKALKFIEELQPFCAILMFWIDDSKSAKSTCDKERAEMTDMVRTYCRNNPGWIVPALAINFDQRVFATMRKRNMTGPLWQYLNKN